MAISSPACTAWCSIMLFSTGRAARLSPNETLLTPSEVNTPGSSALICSDRLDRGHRRVGKFWISGGKREGQGIVDQVFWGEPKLVNSNIIDPLGDFQFALDRFGHPLFINRQDHQGSIVLFGNPKNSLHLLRAGFQVGGIQQTSARRHFEGGFHHIRLGGIDHQRRFHAHRQPS